MRYLAISKLSSAPLWQSVPCLYRICSPDTQNNISRRIISLSLEEEREKERERKIGAKLQMDFPTVVTHIRLYFIVQPRRCRSHKVLAGL